MTLLFRSNSGVNSQNGMTLSPDLEDLFNRLVDLTASERGQYFQEHAISPSLRAQVEQLLSYDKAEQATLSLLVDRQRQSAVRSSSSSSPEGTALNRKASDMYRPSAHPLTALWLALALAALVPNAARASTFTVTNTADSGLGSLRAAISQANIDGANGTPDTINFNVTGTITLTGGTLSITQPVTITGPGAASLAVSGSNASTVFSVTGGTAQSPVAISGLTIENGNANSGLGGGLSEIGGSATVTGCTFTGDSAQYGGGFLLFGGSATVTGCTFTGDSAADGGGLFVYEGSATVTGCTFTGDSATGGSGAGGGGVFDDAGTLVCTNCVFAGNTSNGFGGGLDFNTAPSVTLTGCTVTGNGGFEAVYSQSVNTLTLTDDIFFGDTNTDFIDEFSPSVSVSHCDIGTAGFSADSVTLTANIGADPLFVSSTNLHVQAGSPVVGAGVAVPGLTTDITGAMRANPPTIGAYEGAVAGTSTTLTSSANPSVVGQSVTFTATVANISGSSAVPTGTVSFYLNSSGTAFDTETLSGGKATSTARTFTSTSFGQRHGDLHARRRQLQRQQHRQRPEPAG